jgi:hypothetical protein
MAAMIMPDHVHFLVTLGTRLKLEQTVSKWKRGVRALDKWRTIRWQENFYDHRLRGRDRVDAYGKYMYLNPYRACLLDHDECWPGWFCWKPELFCFLQMLTEDSHLLSNWLALDELPPWDF